MEMDRMDVMDRMDEAKELRKQGCLILGKASDAAEGEDMFLYLYYTTF